MRTIKNPLERRNEILDAAETLFITKGYAKTTINDILEVVGIAKGTFYYYFKAKEEVMDAIVMRFVEAGAAEARTIALDDSLTVHEKMQRILVGEKPKEETMKEMREELHQVSNAEMHLKSIVETVLRLSPILAEVAEQGVREGQFKTPYPRETMDFIVTSASLLFDAGIFTWSPEELKKKAEALIYIIEVTMGAEAGSLSYLKEAFENV